MWIQKHARLKCAIWLCVDRIISIENDNNNNNNQNGDDDNGTECKTTHEMK